MLPKNYFNSYIEMMNWVGKQNKKDNLWWTVKYINKKYIFIINSF